MPEEKFPHPDVPTETETSKEDSFAWTKRKITSVVAGGTALFSVVVVGVAEVGDDEIGRGHPPVSYGGEVAPGDRKLPTYGAKKCPEVPGAYLKKADRMLQAAENPQVTQAVKKSLLSNMTGNYMVSPWDPLDVETKINDRVEEWNRSKVRFPVAKKVADKLSLTVADSREYVQRVGNGDEVDSDLSRDTVLHETQKFLKQYGITIGFATKADKNPVVKLIGAEADDIHTSEALYTIANTIAKFPKEYVAMSGIKNIVLAQELTTPSENDTYNTTQAAMLAEDMWVRTDIADESAVAHEIGHGVMQATCGGIVAAESDPQLAEGMEGSDAYKPEYAGMTYATYAEKLATVEGHMLQGQSYKDYLRTLQANAIKEVSTTSGYAHTRAEEDAAETVKTLTTDEFYTKRHSLAMPKLRRKFDVVLGRILYYRPNIAKYFMQTTLKNEKSSSPLDAIMPGKPTDER